MCSDLLRNIKMRKCNVPVNEQVDDAVMRWETRSHLFVNLIRKPQFVSASVLLKKVPDLSKKNASFVAKPPIGKIQELQYTCLKTNARVSRILFGSSFLVTFT